jgi:hypothetical protein
MRNRLRTRADTDQQHADINASDEIDHNELINKNFWGYVKNIFTKKSDHYQHLISHNAQHILQEHFPQLFQIKFSTFPAGFLNLVPRHHRLILTPDL